MNYLESLNEEQKKAVLYTQGPLLIIAGAGAGKTKTLTHRIFHLMNSGIPPEHILAITFTNKAAREMRERVQTMIGNQSQNQDRHYGMPFMSTFHSLGVQIIKENADILNIPRHFSIYDTSDSKKAIKEALIYLGVDPKEHLDKVKHIISEEKGRGVSVSEYIERESYDYKSELTKKVWKKYEEFLHRDKALDFDDLLLKTLLLLEKNPTVREKYQDRFVYVHIDEYQDTNKVQNRIVDLIAGKHKNICVVGDADQCIYSWRGAEIKHMLHFEKTYPDTYTVFLEQNYRSTKTILAVANIIIEKNKFRIPKKLFTENQDGEHIGLFEGRDEVDEAHFIAMKTKSLIESGVPGDQIAVLYRANFQSRILEEAFLAHTVPYQLLGTKFFERKEVKDILSFIKASLNPDAQGDFLRIINVPPRGIGKTTIDKILENRTEELSPSVLLKIEQFREKLSRFKEKLLHDTVSEAVKYIIVESGMEKLYSTGLEEDTDRLENIMELVTIAQKYNNLPQPEGIEQFLTDSSLASDQDTLDTPQTGVKLMTVHASKGLEFNTVFISGLESDLFPHKGMGGNKKNNDNEEERRLFYVAITRAEKKLFLTHARTRTIFGVMGVNSPSEFIGDIPDEYIKNESYTGNQSAHRKPLFSIDF